MSSENNYHILWCFGDSSRKYCIWLFFFWPVSLVLIPYLFFSSPFSSLVLGCRHDEAFYFYFFILIPTFWNLLFCTMSQRYQFRLFLFGVNVVNEHNLKQIIFSINSVSCSSLLCFCSCSLSACCESHLTATLLTFLWKMEQKGTEHFYFLGIAPIFSLTKYLNNCFLAAFLTKISMGLWFCSLHTLYFLILWCGLYEFNALLVCCCYTCTW